jgi:hypothetical protein
VRRRTAPVGFALIALLGAGCGDDARATPRCRVTQRLGIVAQSVPDAAYVPCIAELPEGWEVRSFDVDDNGAEYVLRSDRDPHDVDVELREGCDVTGAVPIAPRDAGVRSYQQLESTTPRYSGRITDVFPGGCVTYRFDFRRGEHIALLEELGEAVQLYSRRELRRGLDDEFGITLD